MSANNLLQPEAPTQTNLDQLRCTYCPSSYSKFLTTRTLENVFKGITEGDYAVKTTGYRLLLSLAGNDEKRLEDCANFKKTFSGVTFSAICKGRRRLENVIRYVPINHYDADKIDEKEIERIKKILDRDPLVLGYFVSVSGKGLKIIIVHAHGAAVQRLIEAKKFEEASVLHKYIYSVGKKHLETTLGITLDNSCSDIARLCFLSHDAQARLKSSSIPLTCPPMPQPPPPSVSARPLAPCSRSYSYSIPHSFRSAWKAAVGFVARQHVFKVGSRHHFCMRLAGSLKYNRVDREEALRLMLTSEFNFDEKELRNIVKWVYSK